MISGDTPPLENRLGSVGAGEGGAKNPVELEVELDATVLFANLTVFVSGLYRELVGLVVELRVSVCSGVRADDVEDVLVSGPSQICVGLKFVNSTTPEPERFPI